MYFDRKNKQTKADFQRKTLFDLIKCRRKMIDEAIRDETPESEELKTGIRAAAGDIFWWTLPWADIYSYIAKSAFLPGSLNSREWEWEYELCCEEYEGAYFLFLDEHGKKYQVNADIDQVEYWEESKYTKSERAGIVKDYVKNFDRAAIAYALAHEDEITDKDILTYFAARNYFEGAKARSLYTPHLTRHLSVTSTNLHSHKIYAVGQFRVREGILTHFSPQDFKLIDKYGVQVDHGIPSIQEMDSSLLCAMYISGHKLVSAVQPNIIAKNIMSPAASYNDALRQAALYSILGNLLIDKE